MRWRALVLAACTNASSAPARDDVHTVVLPRLGVTLDVRGEVLRTYDRATTGSIHTARGAILLEVVGGSLRCTTIGDADPALCSSLR